MAGVAVGGTAHAAPRRVAVVNTAQDQQAGAELAARLRATMDLDPTVTPIPPGDLARALEGALTAPVTGDLAGVADLLARAREDMAQFDYQSSLSHLAQAEQDLLAAWPSPENARLLVEIALERGRIYMRQRQRERAVQEFVLVHRLDPERRLEPERYLPDVIEAFTDAVVRAQGQDRQREGSPAASVALEITALLDDAAVYVDGRLAGYTPLTVRVAPGAHYVTGTFAGQVSGGQRVVADAARGHVSVKLGLGSVTVDERARHWRERFVIGRGAAGAAPGGRGAAGAAPGGRGAAGAASGAGDGAAPGAGDGAAPGPVTPGPAPLDPGLARELGRGATDYTGADAALVIATGIDGGLHVASYDARTRTASDWKPATERGIEEVLQPFSDTGTQSSRDPSRLSLSGPPSVPSDLLVGSSGVRDDRPWYRRPFYRGLVNSGIAVSVAAVVFYAVLQGSNTVGGTCCTIGTVDRPRSPSFGFSF